MEDDRNAKDDSAAPSKADLVRAKLKLVAHYAMQGFAPAVAVVALVVALIAGHHQPAPVQHDESTVRMDNLNQSLSEARDEVDNLKIALARERSLREEESKKAEARDTQIIQAVSSLQEKMKIAPTLELQLREQAHTPAVPAAAITSSASAAASAPAVTEKKPEVPAPTHAPAAADKKHAAATPKPVHKDKKTAAPAPAKKDAGKTPAQVKALKEAIEKLNAK